MDNKIYRDQKPKWLLLKSQERKQGPVAAPCIQHHQGAGQTTEATLQPDPWTPPSPYPVSGIGSSPAPPLSKLNKQDSLLVLAPPAAGAQIKPCWNYLYRLRRPRPLISISVTHEERRQRQRGQTPWSVGEKPSSS